jgi:hypothetical protein
MFEIPPVTPELLAELGAELGGCDFTEPSQRHFLENDRSCDVQAAPGHGKTTLLAAKLALLSRGWTERSRGICVISHTNAARSEVEYQIANHPTAARLMAYPHFTGTVTAFINQFLALPYLRGMGWSVRQIDDDAFAAEALRRYPSFRALARHAKLAQATVEKWVAELTLDPGFVDQAVPESLAVRHRKGQHGPDTDCGRALAKLKAGLIADGFYRYADMTALAMRALDSTPGLAARLRARFPLVILDEAQDTHGEQLRLLEQLFKHDDIAFQRLGDSNQTLYEDDTSAPTYWIPDASSVPLDSSRRFGAEIALFASRLTVRTRQTILGAPNRRSTRVLLLFDEPTIGDVLGAFAGEALTHWGKSAAERDIWAVASRHSIPGKKGAWEPRSLVDYYPSYRSESSTRRSANAFCRQMQKATLHHAAGRPPRDVAEMVATGIAGFARAYRWKAPSGQPVTTHNLWATLTGRDSNLVRRVKRLTYDQVICGNAAWEEGAWKGYIDALLALFDPMPEGAEDTILDYSAFVAEGETELERGSTKQFTHGDVSLRLGSIHSVKGKSVDGILVVESQVWKGRSKGDQCIDLTTVLPHAFGVADQDFTGVTLTAATNVFVGVTRPRELLGLAMRRSTAAPLLAAAEAQGWKLVDLTK